MKLLTIWRVEKQSREAESEDEKQRRSRARRKIELRETSVERTTREMLGKSRIAVFFQWFGGRLGGRVASLKRRVRR